VEKGGKRMNPLENNNSNVEKALEKLQDAVSLIMILENDLSTQSSDEIHLRAVKVIHELIKTAQNELQK